MTPENYKETNFTRVQYIADGTITSFEIPFNIFRPDYLNVFFNNQQKTSGFHVALHKTVGASVYFTVPPVQGTIITFVRCLNFERMSDFQEGGILRANTLNVEFDYQMACLQQMQETLSHALMLPPQADTSDSTLFLPLIEPGKALIWNEDGTNLTNSKNEIDTQLNALQNQINSAEEALNENTRHIQTLSTTKANCQLDNLTQSAKENIMGMMMPNYAAGILKTWNVPHTAQCNGCITFGAWCNGNKSGLKPMINGIYVMLNMNDMPIGPCYQGGEQYVGGNLFVRKGDIYKVEGGSGYQKLVFNPLYGECIE